MGRFSSQNSIKLILINVGLLVISFLSEYWWFVFQEICLFQLSSEMYGHSVLGIVPYYPVNIIIFNICLILHYIKYQNLFNYSVNGHSDTLKFPLLLCLFVQFSLKITA